MSKFVPLKVTSLIKDTEDAVVVEFKVPENITQDFDFIPGQYLTLKHTINGEDLRRSYSICSAPFENTLKVGIKRIDGGRFSTFANTELKVGDEIEVMPPDGNFKLKPDSAHDKAYVAFVSGSGITPIMSMMKSVLRSEPKSRFYLFYGNRSTSTVMFKEDIDILKSQHMDRLSVFHVLSREMQDSDLFYGRLVPEKCTALIKSIPGLDNIDHIFLCGPGNMVQTLKDHFESSTQTQAKVHAELFSAPDQETPKPVTVSSDAVAHTGESRIVIKLDNHEYSFDLEFETNNILDAAIAAGVDLPFSCKGGVCCTCRAKVTQGEVQMMVNYALEPEEVEEGFVLTCQSYPKEKLVRLDFDE